MNGWTKCQWMNKTEWMDDWVNDYNTIQYNVLYFERVDIHD